MRVARVNTSLTDSTPTMNDPGQDERVSQGHDTPEDQEHLARQLEIDAEGERRATPGALGREGGVHEASFHRVRPHFAR